MAVRMAGANEPGEVVAADQTGNDLIYRLRGATTIPSLTLGRVTASWPFGVLRCYPNLISVDIEPRWIKSLGEVGVDSPPGYHDGVAWSIPWGDVDRALITAKSLVIVPEEGRGCRFVALRQHGIKPVFDQLSAHGIVLETVATTCHKTFTI